ncbi:MAG: hypothetical protein WKF37_22160 [Bryobacteraceae bacterium]
MARNVESGFTPIATGSGTRDDLHRQRMFRHKGRDPRAIDRFLYPGISLVRKLMNPYDTIERLRGGPIYQSKH